MRKRNGSIGLPAAVLAAALAVAMLLPEAIGAAPARQAASRTVPIKGFAYHPKTIHVTRGSRITWVNRDSANHTVTGRRFNISNITKGQRKGITFRRRGSFAYHCGFHPFMKGKVVVG